MNLIGNILPKALALAITCMCFINCTHPPSKTEEVQEESYEIVQASNTSMSVKVKTTPPIQIQSFDTKMIATGKIEASEKTELKLKSSGVVEQLPLKEGQTISKGSLIAKVEDENLQLQLQQRKQDLEEVLIEKADLLVLYDGDVGIDSSVAPHILKRINIKSGLNRTLELIKQTEYQISQTEVLAPFNGKIADLEMKQYHYGNQGEYICKLINPASFEAVFTIIEQEALKMKEGQAVEIEPLATPGKKIRGKITSINPLVDRQGLVLIRAKVLTGNHLLLEGMNCNISILKKVNNVFVIPKNAIVQRSGRAVVFTYEDDEELAKWNYVTISHENNLEVAISEGLKAGDQVIVEGNVNLDDKSSVQVIIEEL